MPPRVAAVGDGPGLSQAYLAVPPVTRALGTAAVALSLATKFGLLPPAALVLTSDAIWRLELWRFLTAPTFLGPMSFGALIQTVWLVQYGQALEAGVFVASTADFAYLVLFVATVLTVLSLAVPALGLVATCPSLVFALLYIWSRHNPRSQSSIMGLVTLPALYLPWAFLAMAVCGVGGSPVADGVGLVVGHLYFFLTAIHPAAGGRRLLATPRWLSRALLRASVGRVPVAAAGLANPAAPGFRAFGGAGRRLAD